MFFEDSLHERIKTNIKSLILTVAFNMVTYGALLNMYHVQTVVILPVSLTTHIRRALTQRR